MEKRIRKASVRSQEKDFNRRGRTYAFKGKQENNKKREKKSGYSRTGMQGLVSSQGSQLHGKTEVYPKKAEERIL